MTSLGILKGCLLLGFPVIIGAILACICAIDEISKRIPRSIILTAWILWFVGCFVCGSVLEDVKRTDLMRPYIQMSENPKAWLEEKVRNIPNIGKGGTLALVEREIGKITEAIHDDCRCHGDEEVMILGNARESLRKLHSELEQIGK